MTPLSGKDWNLRNPVSYAVGVLFVHCVFVVERQVKQFKVKALDLDVLIRTNLISPSRYFVYTTLAE